jgi:hypothetical protein
MKFFLIRTIDSSVQLMSPATPTRSPWCRDCSLSHKQLPEAATPHEKTALERQIKAADGLIDALVYELYALTEEEIGIVEDNDTH